LGSGLRDKKIVIALSPGRFFDGEDAPADQYAGTFSRLHAYQLLFESPLELATKQAIARRMLKFPDTLQADTLLRLALEKLADGSPGSLAQYEALVPVGRLEALLMSMQDRVEM